MSLWPYQEAQDRWSLSLKSGRKAGDKQWGAQRGTLPGVSNLSSLMGTLILLSTDEETEAQRQGATCPRTPRSQGGADRTP